MKKELIISFIILLVIFITAFLLIPERKEEPTVVVHEQKEITITEEETEKEKGYVKSWDAETASYKKYSSLEQYDKEKDSERSIRIEEYNKAIKGTVAEQLNSVEIPNYWGDMGFEKLKEGQVSVRTDDGSFDWGASLAKGINYFTIGDFNNDGLDDVAQVIGYTGGGSGYFYDLAIFINVDGTLKFYISVELGDRIVVKGLKYSSRVFTVDMIVQGEGDDFKGFCCPNVPETLNVMISGDSLLILEEL